MKERSESEERETIYPPFSPPPKKIKSLLYFATTVLLSISTCF